MRMRSRPSASKELIEKITVMVRTLNAQYTPPIMTRLPNNANVIYHGDLVLVVYLKERSAPAAVPGFNLG
jgi:hypothetical protein